MKRPIRTASPILRELFEIAELQGMNLLYYAASMDKHPNQLSGYRTGKHEPGIMTVEEMADALGYKLTLTRLDEDAKPI